MKQFILLIILNGCLSYAQDPYAIKYGIDEGLPTSNIYSVFEDSMGYLWFGTDVGVLKYDGYDFDHYSIDDGLADNEVFKIFEDSNNRIWFFTLNGQLSFYKDGNFTNTKNNSLLLKSSHPKMIMNVYERHDELAFLYRDGMVSTVNLKESTSLKKHFGHSIFGYWKDEDKTFYLTMNSVFDVNEGVHYSFNEEVNPSTNYRLIDHDASKLFSIGNQIYEFNDGIEELDFNTSHEIIHMASINDNLWLGTRSGLVLKSENSNKLYFKGDVVSFIIRDSQNNYWVTTLNNGIRFIPNMDIVKYNFTNRKIKVNDILKVKSELFVGSENGLYKLNNLTDMSNVQVSSLNSDYIKRLRYYNGKVFSIGNTSINIYDKSKLEQYNFGANDCYFNGTSYVFSSSVVFKFLREEMYKFPIPRNINAIEKSGLENKTLFKKRTNVISPFKNNKLILGTSLGLYEFKNDSIYRVFNSVEALNTSIQALHYDTVNDRMIVATNSKGISIIEGNQLAHHFSKKQNLSSNTVNTIEVLNNDIFIGTNSGIDKISISGENNLVENINSYLGLKKEKINSIEIQDSILYFGTDKGLFSFKLETIKPKIVKPKLVVESVLINDYIANNLNNLKSDENNLSLSFIGISYADFGDINYQYRINEEDWIEIEGRTLEIKNLSSGEYNIELRAKGKQNIWSDSQQLHLNIKPPFYKTLPFILFAIAGILFLIYFFVGKRIDSIKKAFNKERKILKDKQDQIQIEKQMLDLEQKALRMQMNPHFIFNALNTIKGYYSGGNLKEANNYISQLSKLLRLILENDERLITLDKEIEIIDLYIKLIQLRYVDVFEYEIKVDPKIDQTKIGLPTLILQPLVENAIIHGLAPKEDKGKLNILFNLSHNKLICKVIDDGVGFTHSIKNNNSVNSSKALKITKERIDIENSTSDDDNFVIKDGENNTGTEVTIRLPILKIW